MKFRRRFIIRREYFGAYVFDRDLQLDYIFDGESADVFKTAYRNLVDLEKEDYINLCDYDFISNGRDVNFDYFENEVFGECFSAPIVVHFPYTSKCNLNCKHCFSKSSGDIHEIPFEIKIKVLDELKDLGVCKIMIGGGEPFLGADIVSFLKESVNRGLVTKVFTNGLVLNDDIIESLTKINLGGLSISIDTPDVSIYKKIRGVNGLPVVIENVKKLVAKCAFPISISATIGTYNIGNECSLLDLAKECGVSKLKVRPVRPSGNAHENRDILPSAEAYAVFLTKIQKAYFQKRHDYSFGLDLHWGSGKIVASKTKIDLTKVSNPYYGFGCIAGKDIAFINTDGSVSPCGFLPNTTGRTDSILHSKLIDIWKNSPNFKCMRELKVNKTCYRCRYYGSCRGGCPARNIHEHLDYTDMDPWCPRKFFPISLID